MKKVFNLLLLFVFSLSTSFSLSSCNDFGGTGGNDDNSGNNDSGNGIPNTGQVYKDKSDFENIAIEFMNEFKASNFEEVINLTEDLSKTYSDYEFDGDDWEDFMSITTEKESDLPYPTFETIYKASATTGEYIAEEGQWKKVKELDYLVIKAKDQNEKWCEITLKTSGNTKRVFCFNDLDWDYEYDEATGTYEEYISGETSNWVEVPENITIVFNHAGSKLAEAIINTDLSSMEGSNYNLSKDKYSANATVYFNGYSYTVEKVKYENKKECKVVTNFKHGNKLLLSSTLSVTPQIEDSYSGTEIDEDDIMDIEFINNSISINFLNKMELRGSCNSAKGITDIFVDSEEGYTQEIANRLNEALKINLYFYGATKPTAKIESESYKEAIWDEWDEKYKERYILIPVIVFNDGSRNKIEDFFNGDDFNATINAYNALIEEYSELMEILDEYFGS